MQGQRLRVVQNPAYRLIRHKVFEGKEVSFRRTAIVARLWHKYLMESRHLFQPEF